MAKTACVILNYNDSENVIKLFNKIKDYKCLDEIIVVDNHSTDNSYERLKEIDANGGVEEEVKRTATLAKYFRSRIKDLPLEIVSESMSNAVTPLHPLNVSAYSVFTTLKDEYGIWVCPNGGDMKDTIFRVGHIGCLTTNDYDSLISALRDMLSRGLL